MHFPRNLIYYLSLKPLSIFLSITAILKNLCMCEYVGGCEHAYEGYVSECKLECVCMYMCVKTCVYVYM